MDGADAIYLGRPDVQDSPELITQLIAAAPGAHAEVTAVVPPLSEALAGAGPWIAEVVGDMFGRVHDGTFATVSDTVEKVAGRSPRTIKEFIAEHADQWRV